MSKKDSYGQILKSSSIMGGAASINMLLGMVRVKFAAVLIGTTGVGLLANLNAIHGMIGMVAGLGIDSSAVRDVAEAAGNEDQQAIGRKVLTLRRICWLTGLTGMSAMIVLSPFLSQWTFGHREYMLEIASLGFVVLFAHLSGGQTALIRGMRHIGDMARLTIIGATVGTIGAIGFYLLLGLRGIVPALVLTAAVQLAASWYFAKRIPVPQIKMTWRESFREAGDMLRLGIAMMWAGFIGSIAIYITNTMITRQISLEAVGLYSAAFALSGMFVNFVLQAMSADYYPRLTGAAPDKVKLNKLVNEQTEIGLLLAAPGLLATLSLAPWVIHIFYTSEFLPAANLLQWLILGCLLRVIQWPMGFLQLALGRSGWWFITQTLFTTMHLGFVWVGLLTVGIEGVSIAFFLLYVFSLAVIMLLSRHLTGFSWSASTRTLLLILLPIIGVNFVIVRILPLWSATIFGIVLTVITSILCLRGLVRRVGPEHRLSRILCKFPRILTFFDLKKYSF